MDQDVSGGKNGGVPAPVHHHSSCSRSVKNDWGGRSLSRRGVLAGAGAMAATALAGCSALDGEPAPAAVSVGGTKSCDVCGMVISKHPGPNAQIFYKNHDPEGHDPPFRFDSLKACGFDHYFTKKRQGWSIAAFYVTDYSIVDYSLSEEGGKTFISGHEAPESFARAKSVEYVVDADVYGAMGRDFVPFSDADEATTFAEAHGGTVVAFEDISPATLE